MKFRNILLQLLLHRHLLLGLHHAAIVFWMRKCTLVMVRKYQM